MSTTVNNKMNIEKTLNLMAKCDFSAPLTVTIEYEDSDDEVKIESNFYERTTPKHCDDTYVEYQPSNQDDQEKRIPSPVTKSCEYDLNSKRTIKNSELDESSEECLRKNKVDNTSSSDFTSVNNPNNVSNGQLVSNVSEHNLTNKNNKCTKSCYERLNNSNCNESNNAENKSKQDYDELNRYFNVLLDKVSESLLHILKAYQEHLANIVNHSNDILLTQSSKKRYMRIKYYFYQLSYCTVVTVMISRENDNKFVDTFLSNTVDMGKQFKINISTEQIKPFYYEMLLWAKQKKNSNNSTPLLSYQLSQPPLSLQKPVPNPPENCDLYHTTNSDKEIKITTVNDQNETILLYSNVVRPQVNSEKQRPQTLRSEMIQQHYPVNDYDDSIRNNLIYNKQAKGLNRTAHVSRNNFVEENTSTSNNYVYTHNLPVNHLNIRLPQPYEECRQRNHYSSYISRNHERGKNTDQIINPQNDSERSRSSISTDSGYIGCDNVYSPDDTTFIKEPIAATTSTPYITHVTSLNPKALQMLEGHCRTCNILTKTKCLGCYQVHYCSYNCQILDWKTHMLFCGHNSTARQYNDCNQNKRV